jgi:hypothetical protein
VVFHTHVACCDARHRFTLVSVRKKAGFCTREYRPACFACLAMPRLGLFRNKVNGSLSQERTTRVLLAVAPLQPPQQLQTDLGLGSRLSTCFGWRMPPPLSPDGLPAVAGLHNPTLGRFFLSQTSLEKGRRKEETFEKGRNVP